MVLEIGISTAGLPFHIVREVDDHSRYRFVIRGDTLLQGGNEFYLHSFVWNKQVVLKMGGLTVARLEPARFDVIHIYDIETLETAVYTRPMQRKMLSNTSEALVNEYDWHEMGVGHPIVEEEGEESAYPKDWQ